MGATNPAWTLWVPGEPRAMQTGSVVRTKAGRAFPVRRRTEWGNRVALAADAIRPPMLFEGPLRVKLAFYRIRPRSLPKRMSLPTTRPDLENGLKVLDALNGVIWRDDAQIVELHAMKVFAHDGPGGGPGLRITVEGIG